MRHVLLLAALAACHHGAESDPIDDSLQPGVVKLVDPGQGDRRLLQFHPAPGTQQSLTVTATGHMSDSAGTNTDVDAAIGETIAVGDAGTLDVTLQRATLAGHAQPAEGKHVHMTMAADGELSGLDGDPAALRLQHSFQQLIVPVLPSEPIAPGARWRYLSTIDNGLLQSSYTLTSVDGDTVVVHVQQRIRSATAAGSVVEVGGDGSGEGDFTLDLGKPMPIAASTQTSMTMKGRLDGRDLDMSLQQSVTVEGR